MPSASLRNVLGSHKGSAEDRSKARQRESLTDSGMYVIKKCTLKLIITRQRTTVRNSGLNV